MPPPSTSAVVELIVELVTVRIGNGDVEGIHILNQSSVKYDVTDTDGSFEVFAKLNDTLVVSALKYKTKTVILNTNNFNKTILQI